MFPHKMLEELTDQEILEKTINRDRAVDYEDSAECFDGNFSVRELIGKTISVVRQIQNPEYLQIEKECSQMPDLFVAEYPKPLLDVIIFSDGSFLVHDAVSHIDDPNTEKFYYYNGERTFYSEENFAKIAKFSKRSLKEANSCCFRGCKICIGIYSNFSERFLGFPGSRGFPDSR